MALGVCVAGEWVDAVLNALYGLSAHFVRFGIVRGALDHIIAREGHYCGFMRVFYGEKCGRSDSVFERGAGLFAVPGKKLRGQS